MNCCSCTKTIPSDAVFCQFCGKKQPDKTAHKTRRGNGLGSVYRQPCGTWAAEVTIGFYVEDGKTKRKRKKKKGFTTKKEAILYLEQLREEKMQDKKIRFCDLWAEFEPHLEDISKTRRDSYNIAWSKISPLIAHKYIADITTKDLIRIAEDVAPTFYPRKDVKSVLSALYKLALQDDAIDRNRALEIPLPQHQTAEREVLTDDEIGALWADWNATKDKTSATALIMLYTGMRPAEILNVTLDLIHLDEHYMYGGLKTEKGKNRKIIIPDKLAPVISELTKSATKKRLLYYCHRTSFYDAFQLKRAELHIRDCISPYCCRHTYITRLTALNVSPAMLQELAGHEDYDTTLNYTHLSVADRLQAVNQL